MKLHEELKLREPLSGANHEALLNVIRTAAMLQKLSDRFFSQFKVTDAQFNMLMILKDGGEEGLSQQELSERLIVTKSNVVGLVDRLEKAGYLKREANSTDRRCNRVVLTSEGKELVSRVEKVYFKEVDEMMNVLSDVQKGALISAMDQLRQYIRERQ
ncbi:MAG TPA: MarR family transcriptional regulator [Blastocatellia bacterium]|nr:MarR family transcriptional regulator [Blastocatellia bacterium]